MTKVQLYGQCGKHNEERGFMVARSGESSQ